MSWRETAEKKRQQIYSALPKEWILDKVPSPEEQKDVTGSYISGLLTDKEREITNTDAVGIVAKASNGTWTAVEITKAFCHTATIAHQLLNCLHEVFFNDALSHAQALDDHFARMKQPIGPLHGLPISLKDQFHVKGVETCMGYVGWIGTFQGKKNTGKEKVFESLMVEELRELGAVLYCKTSVPMTLMSGETLNNIVGYCLNPKNRLLSAGGSSGGEGALIGLRGSPVGFGTDIGGSIRIPAAFNGLFGLRPSHGRLPYEGMANSFDGQNSILSVVGPLATSAASLKLVTKALLSTKPWLHDPLVVEMPWRDDHEQFNQLAVGILAHDGIVSPTPPVRRAIGIVQKALENAGHKIMTWTPPSHQGLQAVANTAFSLDGFVDGLDAIALSGEDAIPQLAVFNPKPDNQLNATAIARAHVTKREVQKEYMEYWNTTGADFVLSPVAPYPAARRNLFKYYGYSMWVNALDYTSVVVPVTIASKDHDPVDVDFKAANAEDQEAHDAYDPDVFDGAHVSLQLVGRRLQEEKMIAIADYVSKLLSS